MDSIPKIGGLLILAALPALPSGGAGQESGAPVPAMAPVLDFPEPGLDDAAVYGGYRTRFFRDAAGNTVQVYLKAEDGRVVALWANAANESAGFTVRDAAGRPLAMTWAGPGARAGEAGGRRWVELELAASSPGELRIGLFALGTMRFERDIQYRGQHRGPLDAPLRLDELVAAADALARLPPEERGGHLGLLRASSVAELRSRLEPSLELARNGGWRLRVVQPSFDGAGSLELTISGDEGAEARLEGRVLTVRPRGAKPARLGIRVATDAASLTALSREEIFTADFLAFVAASGAGDVRQRRLERQVRSAELLSSREKLMAGLPNFATYFGRDMLMTALMMRPVWRPAMTQHVIAIALGKLGPDGGVSHEEALGGQAVREAAGEYAALVESALSLAPEDPARARALESARAVLGAMAATRENHRMMDDDFQLPVVVAGWLDDLRIPTPEKRAFLLEPAGPGAPDRLSLLVRNLGLVADRTAPYASDPRPTRLVAFPRMEDGRFFPGSWRDSGAGYGNGAYALDVNAIWAPAALEATGRILEGVRRIGLGEELDAAVATGSAALRGYVADPARLAAALETWRGAIGHFMVELDPARADAGIRSWLATRPAEEAAHWRAHAGAFDRALAFPALALDSTGRPIPVLNTDPAMALFLGGPAALGDGWAFRALEAILRPYPAGLLVEGVGPVVSNDVHAAASVRAAFEADAYHSPRVVWGREANLLLLGLANRIAEARSAAESASDAAAAASARAHERVLRSALDRIRAAVEASGLKHHELWSYRVGDGGVEPIRYGSSTDVQLWNVTDLAVQYALARLTVQ